MDELESFVEEFYGTNIRKGQPCNIVPTMTFAGLGGSGFDLAAFGLENAVLFGGTTSDYLSFTNTTDASDLQSWSCSFWYKFGTRPVSNGDRIFGARIDANNRMYAQFREDNGKFEFVCISGGAVAFNYSSTQAFRDYGDWFHVAMKVADDLTFQLAINGEEVTDWDTSTNSNGARNAVVFQDTAVVTLGVETTSGGSPIASYVSQFFMTSEKLGLTTDLAPDTDANGDIIAKDMSSVGSPEHRLLFANASTLGENDGSYGDWTKNGTVTQVTDTPTNNLLTFDPNNPAFAANTTLSNGNKTITQGTGFSGHVCTLRMPKTGKWSIMYDLTGALSISQDVGFGIAVDANGQGEPTGTGQDMSHWYTAVGCRSTGSSVPGNAYFESRYSGGSTTSEWTHTAPFVQNDEIEFQVDRDAGTVDVVLNGTGIGSQITGLPSDDELFVYMSGIATNFSIQNDHTPSDSSYKVLSEANLPAITENLDDHFGISLWTGDAVGGRKISTNFAPGWVYIKGRSSAQRPLMVDLARDGTTYRPYLLTDLTNGESESGTIFETLDSDGFSVGSDAATNGSGITYVGWHASLPNSKTSGWTGGTITPNKEVYNTTLGLSVLEYDGVTGAQTVPSELINQLGKPFMIIIKRTDTNGNGWIVYHENIGADKYLALESSATQATNTVYFNNTEPTNQVFSVGASSGATNLNGGTYVAYIFCETVFCKPIAYDGNANSDGAFANLNIKPVWFIEKTATTTADGWNTFDEARDPYNPANHLLQLNTNSAEATSSNYDQDMVSNGIKQRTATLGNYSGRHVGVAIGRPIQATKAR